jgi:hypothetical protein
MDGNSQSPLNPLGHSWRAELRFGYCGCMPWAGQVPARAILLGIAENSSESLLGSILRIEGMRKEHKKGDHFSPCACGYDWLHF